MTRMVDYEKVIKPEKMFRQIDRLKSTGIYILQGPNGALVR